MRNITICTNKYKIKQIIDRLKKSEIQISLKLQMKVLGMYYL